MTNAKDVAESRPASPSVGADDPGAGLIARYLAGDVAAFNEIVATYRAPVYGYLLRSGVSAAVADELFQETFLRVHASARRYRPIRPFRVWIFTIANNLIRSHHRKRKLRRALTSWWIGPSSSPPDAVEPGPGPDRRAATREAVAWLHQALRALPDGSRRAILLTQVEGMSQADAAQVLGVPTNTVKTWVRRGRLSLAEARAKNEGGAT